VGALQYHENQVELLVGPGLEPGSRAIISTSPPGSGLLLDHGVVTAAAGEPTRLSLGRVPGSTLLTVRGQIAADAQATAAYAGVESPTLLYVNNLREALERHGIYVAVGTADIDDVRVPPARDSAIELIVDRSPPLADLVDVTLKWSRNGYAETLLYSMSPPGEPATAAAGLRAMQETLDSWGVPRDSYMPHDGSGLSRYDYLTAHSLVRLLTSLWSNAKHAEPFRRALPVAGVSGMLANRLKGTAAESRVWAKSGSMSNVRSLAGYLTTIGEEPLVFAILVNGYRVPSSQIDEVVNKVVLRLVEFRR
jgi:D-alanyl-D-alanine carboxypeptidase/D-alanyl-D-alanine-endopeptidase (penicillin-binding protein 4)